MAEKLQKKAKNGKELKDWLNKEKIIFFSKEEFQKPGEYLAKTGDRKYSPKPGGFRPKGEGWNLHTVFSNNIP